jgi:hypothetical protein
MNINGDRRELRRGLRREIFRRALDNMTAGADKREVVFRSLVLSFLAMIFTIPYFYYLVVAVPAQIGSPKNQGAWSFIVVELLMLFIILFLSSVIGFSFSKRYELPGLGDVKKFLKSIPILFLVGIVMIAFSFYFFDRFYFELSPQSYPGECKYLFTLPLKGALADEIILRLGMTTIAVGLLRHKEAGVVLVSALSAFLVIKYNQFLGIPLQYDYLFLSQLFFSFCANFILGYLFVRYGLLFAMGLKFFFGFKYIVVTLLLGTVGWGVI